MDSATRLTRVGELLPGHLGHDNAPSSVSGQWLRESLRLFLVADSTFESWGDELPIVLPRLAVNQVVGPEIRHVATELADDADSAPSQLRQGSIVPLRFASMIAHRSMERARSLLQHRQRSNDLQPNAMPFVVALVQQLRRPLHTS